MSSRSTHQRNRRYPATPRPRRTAKTNRTARMPTNRTARMPTEATPTVSVSISTVDVTSTIDVLEEISTASGDENVDVVDLTCEGAEPAPVVDLTNNDSVVVVDEAPRRGRRRRGGTDSESYVLSSDEEDTNTALNAALLSSLEASSRARSTPGTISCPVCLDAYGEIMESGRLVVSTKCGHLFCSQCLRDSLARSHTCPTCRNKLTPKQYHPIYI